MMRAAAAPDLVDRLTVEVDPSAEAADWDQALAVFLLRYVRSQATSTVGTAAAVAVDHNSTSAGKASCHAIPGNSRR